MRKAVLLFVFAFMCYQGYSQSIENKVNIYFGYNTASFSGQKVLDENGFKTTSLFPSYHSVSGESIKVLMSLNKYCSVGLGFDAMTATRWENKLYTDYLGSSTKLIAFSPTFNIHTNLRIKGIASRMKLFAELAPSIGQSKIKLANAIFDLQKQGSKSYSPTTGNDIFVGAKWSTGMEVVINQYAGFFYTFSIQQDFISSKLYNDKHFFCTNMNLGLFIRLKKDKHFLY